MTRKIYGGPGCGKTYAMLGHFTDELKSYGLDEVAFLTFTRSARAEAVSRTGRSQDELPYVRTIHALCFRQLGLSRGRVVSGHDLQTFGKRVGVKFSGAKLTYTDDVDHVVLADKTLGDRILQAGHHLAQHLGVDPQVTLRRVHDVQPRRAKWLLDAYAAWKKAEGLLDYTDLLLEFLRRDQPIEALKVLFVDEAQDLSPLQWRVIHLLARPVERIYLGGDDDQAIFQWAGASPKSFNDFPCDAAEVLPLSRRMPQLVWAQSQAVAAKIRDRQAKDFKYRDELGEVLSANSLKREHLNDERTFVLYRNHFRGFELAKQLELLGVPFLGLSPLDDAEVRVALEAFGKAMRGEELSRDHTPAVVRFGHPGKVTASPMTRNLPTFSATLLFPKPPTDVTELPHYFTRLPHLNYITKAVERHSLAGVLQPKVRLMSIHQSKGQEADTVVLNLEMSRRSYETLRYAPDEEHRVFYVGVSRARRRLVVLQPTTQFYYNLPRKKMCTTA